MKTLRITITPEVQEIIDNLKTNYPTLSEAEIIKLLISEGFKYQINLNV